MKKKICIVTGTRAEWGLLSRLAELIRLDSGLQLQIIATNMHLDPRYGNTYKEIEEAGFTIDYRVPMNAKGDDAQSTVKSMGNAVSGFADAYQALRPNMLVVLGDRYEILAAVQAALIFRIPVAHIHGGEITEGAFDDAIRHAITKMSHLHFTATEPYRERVIQMGEQPDTVFNVGALGVDNIRQIPLWDKEKTEESLGGFGLDKKTILVTFHPVTLEEGTAEGQVNELLGPLNEVKDLKILFTMSNSDTGNRVIAEKIKDWCDSNRSRAIWFDSLGLKRYLSVLQYIGGVVGNSSSGIIEVPSFNIPTINIGDRQKGRTAAPSVINCPPKKEDISAALRLLVQGALPMEGQNPYDKTETAETIHKILRESNPSLQKHFYDLPCKTSENIL